MKLLLEFIEARAVLDQMRLGPERGDQFLVSLDSLSVSWMCRAIGRLTVPLENGVPFQQSWSRLRDDYSVKSRS